MSSAKKRAFDAEVLRPPSSRHPSMDPFGTDDDLADGAAAGNVRVPSFLLAAPDKFFSEMLHETHDLHAALPGEDDEVHHVHQHRRISSLHSAGLDQGDGAAAHAIAAARLHHQLDLDHPMMDHPMLLGTLVLPDTHLPSKGPAGMAHVAPTRHSGGADAQDSSLTLFSMQHLQRPLQAQPAAASQLVAAGLPDSPRTHASSASPPPAAWAPAAPSSQPVGIMGLGPGWVSGSGGSSGVTAVTLHLGGVGKGPQQVASSLPYHNAGAVELHRLAYQGSSQQPLQLLQLDADAPPSLFHHVLKPTLRSAHSSLTLTPAHCSNSTKTLGFALVGADAGKERLPEASGWGAIREDLVAAERLSGASGGPGAPAPAGLLWAAPGSPARLATGPAPPTSAWSSLQQQQQHRLARSVSQPQTPISLVPQSAVGSGNALLHHYPMHMGGGGGPCSLAALHEVASESNIMLAALKQLASDDTMTLAALAQPPPHSGSDHGSADRADAPLGTAAGAGGRLPTITVRVSSPAVLLSGGGGGGGGAPTLPAGCSSPCAGATSVGGAHAGAGRFDCGGCFPPASATPIVTAAANNNKNNIGGGAAQLRYSFAPAGMLGDGSAGSGGGGGGAHSEECSPMNMSHPAVSGAAQHSGLSVVHNAAAGSGGGSALVVPSAGSQLFLPAGPSHAGSTNLAGSFGSVELAGTGAASLATPQPLQLAAKFVVGSSGWRGSQPGSPGSPLVLKSSGAAHGAGAGSGAGGGSCAGGDGGNGSGNGSAGGGGGGLEAAFDATARAQQSGSPRASLAAFGGGGGDGGGGTGGRLEAAFVNGAPVATHQLSHPGMPSPLQLSQPGTHLAGGVQTTADCHSSPSLGHNACPDQQTMPTLAGTSSDLHLPRSFGNTAHSGSPLSAHVHLVNPLSQHYSGGGPAGSGAAMQLDAVHSLSTLPLAASHHFSLGGAAQAGSDAPAGGAMVTHLSVGGAPSLHLPTLVHLGSAHVSMPLGPAHNMAGELRSHTPSSAVSLLSPPTSDDGGFGGGFGGSCGFGALPQFWSASSLPPDMCVLSPGLGSPQLQLEDGGTAAAGRPSAAASAAAGVLPPGGSTTTLSFKRLKSMPGSMPTNSNRHAAATRTGGTGGVDDELIPMLAAAIAASSGTSAGPAPPVAQRTPSAQRRCHKEGCTKWAKRSTTGVSLYCKAHMKKEGLQPLSSIKRCAQSGCTHAAKPDTTGKWLYCKGHMQLYGMWPRDYKSQPGQGRGSTAHQKAAAFAAAQQAVQQAAQQQGKGGSGGNAGGGWGGGGGGGRGSEAGVMNLLLQPLPQLEGGVGPGVELPSQQQQDRHQQGEALVFGGVMSAGGGADAGFGMEGAFGMADMDAGGVTYLSLGGVGMAGAATAPMTTQWGLLPGIL